MPGKQAGGKAKNLSEKNEAHFANWIGRQSRSEEVITERLDRSFRAIFAPHMASTPEGLVPLGIHWCLAPVIAPMSELGPDGHPAKNHDMPPVPQPRRMWAGGKVESLDALRVGDHVVRTTTIASVTRKSGRSGELWFVGLDHEYSTSRGTAIRERQDIVYREAAKPSPDDGRPAAQAATVRPVSASWTVATSPVLLFRYSAITFNGHRIHYDHPYATSVEGYDGLVVHGPIQATLLLQLAAASEGETPRHFVYRGLAPAIAGADLFICRGEEAEAGTLWTQSQSGRIHMEAQVRQA